MFTALNTTTELKQRRPRLAILPIGATAEKGRRAVDLMVEHAIRNIQTTLRKVKQARKRR